MNIQTVATNLRNTIAGKEQLLAEYETKNILLAGVLRVNIDELKRILQDVEQCLPKEVTPQLPKCSVCGTTENVKYMGGYQPYLCDSEDCIPF